MMTKACRIALGFWMMAFPVGVVRAGPPADVAARVAAVDASRYTSDTVIVLDQTDVLVQPDGIGIASSCQVVKVLKESGIRRLSVQRFGFDPTTNDMNIEAVRVIRADGGIEDVPVETVVEQPEPQWGIFWGSRQLIIGVPRLEVGDAVETRTVKTGFNVAYLSAADGSLPAARDDGYGAGTGMRSGDRSGAASPASGRSLEPPMPGHWYDEVSFASSTPIIEKRYSVRVPRDKVLQYAVYNGEVQSSVLIDGDHVVYTFEKKDIAPAPTEPQMVAGTDVYCKVVLATVPDWITKSKWFYEKNEPSLEVNDEIRAKVEEIIRGLSTDEEKITALNHWVAENIRYVGTSRGACEGYTTHPVEQTFRDRGGVCKDKAGLLVAMLRIAGYESYIVMTQAGSDVMPVPADQFNHAVTCIRQPDGAFRLLDPTWMPKSRENWSSAEQLQHVVYGTPEGQPLTRSPYSGPENNTAVWQGRTTLTDDNRLAAEWKLTATGVPETNLRRALAGRHDGERFGWASESLARVSCRANMTTASIMDPVDFSGPISVSMRFDAEAYALGDDGRRWMPLPMMRAVFGDVVANDVWGSASPEQRRFPLRLRSTRRLQFDETITLPAGWKAAALPEAKTIDGPAAGLSFRIEQNGQTLHYHCQVDLRKHRVPPEEYAGYRNVIQTLEDLRKTYIRIERDGGIALR